MSAWTYAVPGALLFGALAMRPLRAQASDSASTGTWHIRAIHVSPHLVVLTPTTRSATLEFRNTGNVTTDAVILVQLGYTYFPNRDTALFPPHWTITFPRDTVIAHPGPQDHYLGPWLSGVPTHITLAANETRRVTLQINPPPHLPNGEYFARIVTLVGPHQRGKAQDVKRSFQLPVKGQEGVPPLRDSVRVFYRQGPQTMGVQILHGSAHEDTTAVVHQAESGFTRAGRFVIQYHLSGTAHFEGRLEVTDNGHAFEYRNTGGQMGVMALHRDGIIRMMFGDIGSGPHHVVIRFLPQQDEFPPDQRLSMEPATIELPFDAP